MTGRRRPLPFLIPAIIILGFALVACAYWPGVMIDDARWQYQQAVDNQFEDWHPPLMAWVWRRLAFAIPGPAPMLLLQLLLYWAGIGLIAWWAYRKGQRGLAIASACAGFLPAPFALTGAVLKDVLMAGCLLCATGLLLWRRGGAAILFLFIAAALRLNAVFACLPLMLAALPVAFTRTRGRLAGSAIIAATALLATGPAISALVQAEDTKVDLSLIIFDLGGITEHSRANAFPDFGVRDPVAANHRCYDPNEWDSYSTWATRPCPLGFDRFDALVDEGDINIKAWWLRAIFAHPVAYAKHRLDHFNRETWFLVPENPAFTAWTHSVPNPWGFQVRQRALPALIERFADAAAMSPLGWPIFWISLALGALLVAFSSKCSPAIRALAASAFLYGLSYLLVGVAVGMRYYFWTIIAAALAVLVVGVELRSRVKRPPKAVLVTAFAIVVVPTLMAIAARVALP